MPRQGYLWVSRATWHRALQCDDRALPSEQAPCLSRRKRKLTQQMAVAVVGGINELVLTYIERDRVSAL